MRLSLNRIYFSKPEIKHTNSKVLLTLYVYNREGISLLKNIQKIREYFFFKVYQVLYKNNGSINNYSYLYKSLLYKEILMIRRYKFKLNSNKFKFEDIFLNKLGKLVSKLYNKKVEFNIINLQSIVLNADIFIEFLKTRLTKNINAITAMNYGLAKINLAKINSINKKNIFNTYKDLNFIENITNSISVNYTNKTINNLDNLLRKLSGETLYNDSYYKSNKNILLIFIKNFFKKSLIFHSIKYKNIRGIKLQVKGRLTRRYRADRSMLRTR
jgi:hypothetical protein